MWLARQSLTTRLIVSFVGAAIVLVLVTSGVLYAALANGLQWRDDQVLEKRMLTVRDLIQAQNLDPDSLDHEVSEDLEGPRQLFMRIIGPPNVGLHETPLTPAFLAEGRFPAVMKDPAGTVRRATLVDERGREFRVLSARVRIASSPQPAWATIQVAADTSLDAEVLNWYTQLIAAAVTVVIALSMVSGWLLVRAQMRPLAHFATETAKVESSKLDYRLALAGLPAELRDLGEQFNQMLARLEKAYGALRSYADDIAHELRTPLNRMLLESELALRQVRTAEAYRAALESNYEECEQLTRLVSSLLFLARAENGQAMLVREDVDVAVKLEKIRAFFESSAAETGVTLSVECAPSLRARIDPALFQRAISNIVANALAHTPTGGAVSIKAWCLDGSLTIEVADTGEGIPSEQQPMVFDRYFRGGDAGATAEERVGIGLTITKCIVELHGGSIELRSKPKEGTLFRLVFPLV